MKIARAGTFAAVTALAIGTGKTARADDSGPGVTINPGLLVSGVAGPAPAFGVGGELSFMVFPEGGKIQQHLGIGGFSQAQTYNFSGGRYAFGVQAGSLLGVELGYAYRDRTDSTAGMHGVHAAFFGSLGFVVGSLRATVPLATSSEDATHSSPGFELALCLAVKLPIPIGNIDVIGKMMD